MPTDTLPAEGNQVLIEELLRKAEQAPETQLDPVVHEGNASQPAPMIAVPVTSSGHTYIYDTQTGERSVTNNNMLPVQLKKHRDDGTLKFTVVRPKNPDGTFKEPPAGTFKCDLHRDSPMRAEYDKMGLPVCNKATLVSPFAVLMHMRNRHRVSYETLEHMRKEAERKEDREFYQSVVMLARGS